MKLLGICALIMAACMQPVLACTPLEAAYPASANEVRAAFARADSVFLGEVDRLVPHGLQTGAEIQVLHVYKGVVKDVPMLAWSPGGKACEVSRKAKGDRALFFVRGEEGQRLYTLIIPVPAEDPAHLLPLATQRGQ